MGSKELVVEELATGLDKLGEKAPVLVKNLGVTKYALDPHAWRRGVIATEKARAELAALLGEEGVRTPG